MAKIFEWIIYLFSFSMIRYFSIAGLAYLLVYKVFTKKLASNKIQAKHAKKADFAREIIHSINASLWMVFVAIPFFIPPINQYTQQYANISDYGVVYLVFSVIASLVIHDTYFYWMHRLLHHPLLFKHTHLLHHKSTNPSPWTSYAFHTFEAITEGMILPILLFVLPMHSVGISLFIVSGFIINVYGHLGYEIMPKWFRRSVLFEVFNTSVHHNLHHSKFKGNYGLYLRIWDRLMKTEHPQYVATFDKVQEQRFGKSKQDISEAVMISE